MNLEELIRIMAELRGERGCPWDREQTRESLRPFIIEEAYEVIEAIDEGKPESIKEELGDLLFQIVFQSRIAEENGEFGIFDVIESIGKKMINRHPHVFGDAACSTSEEVIVNWEEHKKREGKQRASILEGVPKELPALLRAHRLQSRASRVGFDWERPEDVLVKLDEEVAEFKDAVNRKEKGDIEDELGDILFMIVNISRFIGVNPEDALRKTISKFISRFRYIEMAAADMGRKLGDLSLAEMDALWDEAKKK
ncbi:MAG TPA: nucleoside triphosphate pyrophosphohydrolase [Thermodesulfovibrionales bacterium]|nr:nucleoside triphosphate pyrophosphohydrolase [Thermodesulfovibrionales bacterium]